MTLRPDRSDPALDAGFVLGFLAAVVLAVGVLVLGCDADVDAADFRGLDPELNLGPGCAYKADDLYDLRPRPLHECVMGLAQCADDQVGLCVGGDQPGPCDAHARDCFARYVACQAIAFQ